MPAHGGGKQQSGPKPGAATLVRSDQDSGMALVKSKDGRTKWLTVSTDPWSSSSITWDERVRTWASMLGVCAPPPPPPSSSPSRSSSSSSGGGGGSKEGTPLPTPPPNGSAWGGDEDAVKLQQRQGTWLSDGGSGSGSGSGAATAIAAAPAPVATTQPSEDETTASADAGEQHRAASTAEVDAAAAAAAAPASTARRKPSGTGKRVGMGSFARGFLLGLGGGGGGGSASTKSPTVKAKKMDEATKKADVAAAAAVAVAATAALEREVLPAVDDVGDEDVAMGEPPMPLSPLPAVPVGAESDGLTGRKRWVKGAPPSPDPSNCSDSGGSSDGEGNHGTVSYGEGASSAASAVGDVSSADAVPTVSPKADGMDWLEISPGGSYCSSSGKPNKSTSNETKSSGGGSSKKKKKNKSKSKGGGGAKASAKLPSCPSSSASNMTPMLHSTWEQSGHGQEQAGPAPAATTMSKSKRAKLKQQQKQKAKQQRLKREVTFGRVNLVEFTRDVGGCGVPSDGTWGLALGLPFRESVVDVDGFEASKAEILDERTKELSKKQRHLSTGETRQFDYRPVGERNPLFARLGEKERSKKLLEYACFHKADLEEADRDKDGNDDSNRSLSHSDGHGHGGKPASDYEAHSHKVSHAEFVDKSQEASVELTALRDSRRDNQGCNCSCVRADKLNLIKLRGELSKRGLKASGSKKELVKVLQEAMRREEEQNGGKALKACRTDECQCVRDGVECHADLCNCCKGPSIGEKDAHHGGNCGNPGGVYAYSSSVVRSYRSAFVTSKVVPGRERGHGRSDSICSESH